MYRANSLRAERQISRAMYIMIQKSYDSVTRDIPIVSPLPGDTIAI